MASSVADSSISPMTYCGAIGVRSGFCSMCIASATRSSSPVSASGACRRVAPATAATPSATRRHRRPPAPPPAGAPRDALARCRPAPLARCPAWAGASCGEVGADHEQYVAVVDQLLSRPGAEQSDAADRQRGVIRDHRLAGQCLDHWSGQSMGHRGHLVPGAERTHPGQDGRSLCSVEHLCPAATCSGSDTPKRRGNTVEPMRG